MTSVAFPPDYARSGVFYVAYTDHDDGLVLSSYRRSATDPLLADPASGHPILRIAEPSPAHHGGLMAFGPDGNLYLTTGDGEAAGSTASSAQDTRLLLGKVLRIDPTATGYTVPAGNPFIGGGGRPEVWAYGLRNPRGISFDRVSGTVAIADSGENRFEEIDFLPVGKSRGANFGWPAFEAFAPLRGGIPRRDTVLPALAYRHRPACAVAGGYVVRDPRLAHIRGREIYGDYVFGDYCTGRLYGVRPRAGRRVGKQRSFRLGLRYVAALGQDNQRRVYAVTERGPARKGKATLGSVYRLVPRRSEIPG